MQELQERVHLVAVVGGSGRVARGHHEQRALPFARAAVPRRERRRAEPEDRRAEVVPLAARTPVPVAVLGAAGHEVALAAIGAVDGTRPRDRVAHHRDTLVEPVAQRVDVGGVEHGLAEVAAHEVGPHDAQWIGADPPREAQHREADRFELGRFVGGATAPEVELTELLPAGLVDHGEVDPSADPQGAARRVGRRVETVVVEHRRTVAEQLDVPPCRLREHRLLFGLQRVADPGEVGDHRRRAAPRGRCARPRGTPLAGAPGSPGRRSGCRRRSPRPAAACTWSRHGATGTA